MTMENNGHEKRYGLIGEKLGHSYSPRLHGLLGEYAYTLMPLPLAELDTFMRQGDFAGLNVTIPYKQAVIPYCAELSETAQAIGSVNTLVRRQDGSLFGDNTDAFGFAEMAKRAGVDFAGRKTLVLGSGGTALTACAVIHKAGGKAVVISRQGENNYQNLDRHMDAQVLVNTTPVGMYPAVEASPVDLRAFPRLEGVLEVIYNPLRSRLLQQAEELHIPCAGGLLMLVMQAVGAAERFTGLPVPKERAESALSVLRRDITNLVLVGMPGVGKSVIGKALAKKLGLSLVDTDMEIERKCGCSIPELLAEKGESVFRALEAEVIAHYGKKGGQVLVTGGGAILKAENRAHLRMNGFVVHLIRSIDLLPTAGRPLSKDGETLARLWQQRKPLYEACADRDVKNDRTLAECVQAIEEAYDEALCD